jgi:hypothetical protein
MRQLNFLLIFSFGLAAVTFTLEHGADHSPFPSGDGHHPPPGRPVASGGWHRGDRARIFAVWSGVVKQVETLQESGELEAQKVRIQELEDDLQRYRATVDAQLGLLPAAGGSSAPSAAPAETMSVD